MTDKGDNHRHPTEHKLAGWYHRLAFIRTAVPVLTLCIQTVVLFIQLAIFCKIFNINLDDAVNIKIFISQLFNLDDLG